MGPFTIKIFGVLAQKFNSPHLEVPYYDNTEELLQQLQQQYPQLRDASFSLAVNKELVQGKAPLQGDEEIALLPPFSGG